MINPVSAIFDPLYKAAIAVDDVETYVNELKRHREKGFKLSDITLGEPRAVEKLTKLIRIAVHKLKEVKKHTLTVHQERRYITLIAAIGRIVSESGLKIEM